jgi:hypothetical protein
MRVAGVLACSCKLRMERMKQTWQMDLKFGKIALPRNNCPPVYAAFQHLIQQ